MELTPITKKFVLHWGEMGTVWGVSRSVSQIHALLFIVGKPMHAEAIADTLGIARSNVSTSLRELQNWQLVKTERELRERKKREFDPTLEMLEEALESPDFSKENPSSQQRLRDTYDLMSTASGWIDQMLKLEPNTMMKVLKISKTFKRGS